VVDENNEGEQVKEEVEEEDFKPAEPLPDWLDLPMLTKLESLHTLAEWQFQNTTRLRSTMRNDDEDASWVRLFSSIWALLFFSSMVTAY
jgi:hypothetical protein